MSDFRSILRAMASFTLLTGVSFYSGVAFSADMPLKAPASANCVQAVDGINGKIAGLGGTFANRDVYGTIGSLSLPIACGFGVQFDATAASFDSRFLGGAGGHVFWRDPAKALFGVYGSYTYWDQVGGVRVGHVGPEAELYLGRWTVQGVAGAEFGNNASGLVGGVNQTFNTTTRFFDQVNLAYYLQDDLKGYIGHRYLSGKNALAIGGEYGIQMSRGTMASLFVEGRVGESDFHGVWAGLRFYFGQKDKSLMRRHREDDPTDWNVGIDGTGVNKQQQQSCTPPRTGIYPNCILPPV
jgi:hypothetical protein